MLHWLIKLDKFQLISYFLVATVIRKAYFCNAKKRDYESKN